MYIYILSSSKREKKRKIWKKNIKKRKKKNAAVIYDKIFIYFKLINKIFNKSNNTLDILCIWLKPKIILSHIFLW